MSNKRYYWLKLNENFFEREEIKVIENMPNGKDYIIFYMKLLLKSIRTEGELKFREVIPYTPDMLAAITNTSVDTVRVAIDIFSKLELMEIWGDGTLFMIETQNMIGSETDSARRVRKHRQKKALEEKEENNEVLPCNTDVTKGNGEVIKSNTDIDKDIDIELDIEEETDKDIEEETKEPPVPYEKIKELYNSICKNLSKIRSISSTRKKHLKARWKQFDYDLETFKETFEKVQASDFCRGQNKRGWKVDFDWLIKNDNNMVKVLEGKYDNEYEDGGGQGGTDRAGNESSLGQYEDIGITI